MMHSEVHSHARMEPIGMRCCAGRTMHSRTSSHRISWFPNLRTMYLLAGNVSVPRNFRRPSGKSMYSTGFFVSSCDRAPCSYERLLGPSSRVNQRDCLAPKGPLPGPWQASPFCRNHMEERMQPKTEIPHHPALSCGSNLRIDVQQVSAGYSRYQAICVRPWPIYKPKHLTRDSAAINPRTCPS